MNVIRCVLWCALVGAYSSNALAVLEPILEHGEWSAETGLEYRYFKDPGEFGQTQHAAALRLSAEYFTSWNDDMDLFTFRPYLLLDFQDSERTHFDIREALWIHVGEDWELRSGVTRVFWGKTEFINLVDVINQQDLVDGDDEKLGQPMINLSLVHDWGLFDFYLLLGFRERTYPGTDGRLRTPILVDTDNAQYSSDTGPNDIDWAARWQRPLNDYVEMGLSLFSGVDREPWYSFNFDLDNPMLVPNYHHKDQLGVELEFLYEGWAVKFEAVGVSSAREEYWAAVTGIEYSFYGLFGTNIDMTLITEFMHDSREDLAPGYLEHDIGIGGRFSFNDEYDTNMLGGFLWDPDTEEKVISLEFERRLYSDLKLEIQAVSVLERGTPEVADTNAKAIADILNSPLFGEDAYSYNEVVEFLAGLIEDEGLQFIFDPNFGLDLLQQVQRMADSSRKISVIESDDYIQLKLTYYY
ncbi:MAG: hypothetical protein VYA55_08360 [Pseudomonadota bacterium]|nr:hypothetical protein [Pseudomonadota bacterium]